MDKIIFLDIDGVLNVEVYINAFWDICKRMELSRTQAASLRMEQMRDDYGNLFCPTATRKLEWLIEITKAKIVISSTWRMSGLEQMQAMWKDRKLPGEVIDITPIHITKREPGKSFSERLERGNEIKEWLSKHKEIKRYVIFDDDNDMLPEQLPYFVQTDEVYGITTANVLQAVEIFKLNQ